MNHLFSRKTYLALFAGIFLLEATLALWTGNEYDMTVWFNTGKWMQQGINIYMPDNHVGYLPLWPLWCDVAYRVFGFSSGNIELWRLTVKLPLILSHLALSFVVGDYVAKNFGWQKARKIFLVALTFSFFIFIGAMWGQINTLSALLTFLGFYALTKQRPLISGLLLGLAITLKLYPLVVLPAFAAYIYKKTGGKSMFKFATVTMAVPVIFTAAIFFAFQWDITYLFHTIFYWAPIVESNPVQILGGCMNTWSFASVMGLDVSQSWLLRILWVPILALAALYWFRKPQTDDGILSLSIISLYGVFMLTYAWIPEQTFVDLLPFVLLQITVFNPRKMYCYMLLAIQILIYAFSATNWGPFILSPLLAKFFPEGLSAISSLNPANPQVWVTRGILGLTVSISLGIFLLFLTKPSIIEIVKSRMSRITRI